MNGTGVSGSSAVIVALLVAGLMTLPAYAQIAKSQRCHRIAHDYAKRNAPGDPADGVLGGAVGGAVIGGILGGKSGVRQGAGFGALLGAIRGDTGPGRSYQELYDREYNWCLRYR